MSTIAVTLEAVQALCDASTSLTESLDTINKEVTNLKSVYSENKNGLGAHSDSIQALIDDVSDTGDDAAVLVRKLSRKLLKAAKWRGEIIKNDRYKGLGRSR